MRLKNIDCPVCGSSNAVIKDRYETDEHGIYYTHKTFYCKNCRSHTESRLYDIESEPSEDAFGRIWYSCPNCGHYYNSDEVSDYREYKKLSSLGFYIKVAFHYCPMCDELREEELEYLKEDEYDDYYEYYE